MSALSLVSLEQSQAQLFIDIFPSQDSTNQTLWVFSGTSRSGVTINNVGPYIRRSGSYDRRDTHKTTRAFVRNTAPALYNLTPLFTASTTNAPLDLESLRTRLGATIKLGTTNTLDDITIPSTATNVPTLTFTGRGSRRIASMFLNDVNNTGWDDIGPRVAGTSDLNYGLGQPNVNWIGAWTWTAAQRARLAMRLPRPSGLWGIGTTFGKPATRWRALSIFKWSFLLGKAAATLSEALTVWTPLWKNYWIELMRSLAFSAVVFFI